MGNVGKAWAGLALAACTLAGAAPPAVVEAVQYPAWVVRNGQSIPLAPGMELQEKDRLRTGGNARVHMKLAEGSTVKLGERSGFAFEKVEQKDAFRASLHVLVGAFRFTTDELDKAGLREVDIRIRSVSAGVRGTDLWGKSTPERDFVVLIQGKIEVRSPDHPAVTLDTPLSLYQRKRDSGPALTQTDAQTLAEYARETELAPDGATALAGGRWSVAAEPLRSRGEAQALNRTLRSKGYPAEITGRDPGPYTVLVPGLAGEREARALMAKIRTVKGVGRLSIRQMP